MKKIAGENFILGIVVYDTDGSTPKADIRVTIRNESTNETLTEDSNASGEVVFNLSNLESGWTRGDVISYYLIYQNFQAFNSLTTPATGGGDSSLTLTLTAVASTLTRYFTIQDFLDYYDLKTSADDSENGVKTQQVAKIGVMVEADIDSDTDNKFDTNDGSYYSQTDDIDTLGGNISTYWTTKRPVYAVSLLATTSVSEDAVANYDDSSTLFNSITEDDDFVIDNDTGRISITNTNRVPGARRFGLHIVYTYGQATPADIRQLAIMDTGFRMLGSTVFSDNIKGRTKDYPSTDAFFRFRDRVIAKYKRPAIHNT